MHAVKEITHMNQTLFMYGYLEWVFNIIKQQMDKKAAEPTKKRTLKKYLVATKTSITIAYVKGLSEMLRHCVLLSWHCNKHEVREMADVVY